MLQIAYVVWHFVLFLDHYSFVFDCFFFLNCDLKTNFSAGVRDLEHTGRLCNTIAAVLFTSCGCNLGSFFMALKIKLGASYRLSRRLFQRERHYNIFASFKGSSQGPLYCSNPGRMTRTRPPADK